MTIRIIRIDHFDGFHYGISPFEGTVKAVNDLLCALSERVKPTNIIRLVKLICQDNFRLYILEVDRKIVGMGSLFIVRTLMKCEALIEDVVILPNLRTKGLGTMMGEHLIKCARDESASAIELTSRPEREGGIALWLKLGFKKIGIKVVNDQEKNIYRLEL
ncbi:MAG: GNAT family N-acetyltransferase [Candidatus Portnoybacteria bacterium]|nr:GNAT family N-acetyltransferase [Candidatus Portnoybacteria bacterium]